MRNKITGFYVLFLVSFTLILSLRGLLGNPSAGELIDSKWRGGGIFELSPERGRFGLTYSLIEDKSFYFSTNLARFIVPDLAYKDGHYVSRFAPLTSFIVAPGYVIGHYLGASQVGTFIIISLFALINLVLIKEIVINMGGTYLAGWISGMLFLFATPAYAYAVNLYQHHISTFLILLSSLILIKTKKIWPLFFVWFLCAISIPLDYPNLILMFPIGMYALFNIIEIKKSRTKFFLKIKLVGILTLTGLILPILFFGWFNYKSYNNPFQLSGTVGGVHEIDVYGNPTAPKSSNPENVEEFIRPEDQKKTATGFFKSRNILNGLYIYFLSPDRGIIIFAPIILFGFFGAYMLHKNKNRYIPMLLGIVGAGLVLYSMWGDPWGGWAFGSRYLIPIYAVMAIFIGIALTQIRKKWLLLVLFYPIFIYSILVNTLGALTTSANPPKVEALPLEAISGKRERYSYDRNWEFLTSGRSKSFIFQTWGYKYLSSTQYYYLVAGIIIFLTTTSFVVLILQKNEKTIK